MSCSLQKIYAKIDVESYIEEYVNVEEFLPFCRQCRNYGKNWACPPYDFDPREYWMRFETLEIYGYEIFYSGAYTKKEMIDSMYRIKRRLSGELYALEEKKPGSVSLSAGNCNLCETCTRVENKPCRYPDKMRYSIESLGGNVGKTVSKLAGVRIEWIKDDKLPHKLVLVGGLLRK